MGIIRPATPGFLVTLAATVLLAVVSFCVPYFKSVYFLRANISIGGSRGSITFGTLGYCLELGNAVSCSSPSVGYELDINGLLGNNLPIQIPRVVVKWLTYCLVLHIVALGLAAGATVFGLLAHVREMSMTCCSTFISAFAAFVALLAFIFDIAIFFAARARINAVGSAHIGNATWLTLAAWVLLFFSSSFFSLGRCCIAKRPKNNRRDDSRVPDGAEQLRLDAVKAEADRKARQNQMEGGLPAFPEYQPLTGYIDGDKVYAENPYKDNNSTYTRQSNINGGHSGGGYVRAPAGSRAIDEYYSPSRNDAPNSPTIHHVQASSVYSDSNYQQNAANTAPHPPQRQGSGYAPSQYTSSVYTSQTQSTSPPPPINPYLPPMPQQYGHGAGGSSYDTAALHGQQPTNYSNYDPYDYQQRTYSAAPTQNVSYNPNNYYGAPPSSQVQPAPGSHVLQSVPERNYTLGGGSYDDGAYGASSSLPLPGETSYYNQTAPQPTPINTNTGYVTQPQQSPVKGPRAQNSLSVRNEDAPPIYDAGTSGVQGSWGKPSH